jgi:aspartate/methionine/tyrosine aminotransferase
VNKPYPFTRIKEKLAALGDRAIDFAVGRQRLALPNEIGDWVRSNPDLAMQPATSKEVRLFTTAAAALLAREYSIDIAPDNILPAPGGRAAMSTFVACALEPGDDVFVTEPGYPAFARLARHRHARLHDVLLDGENEFVPDFGEAMVAVPGGPKVIALNYPNNPTGATLTDAAVAAIRRAAGSATIVFNDATYGPLVYDEKRLSLLGEGVLADADIARVELHSFSKLFPMGPVALSFLAGSTDIMRPVSTYSEFAWSPPSKLQLAATTLCLEDAGRMRELREFFPARLRRLGDVLKQVGFMPFPSPAGVYILCRLPSGIAGQTVDSAEEAAAVLIDRFDLAVVPWDVEGQHYLRFSALYRHEDLDRLSGLRDELELA